MDSMTQIFVEENSMLINDMRSCLEHHVVGTPFDSEIIQELFRGVHTIKADAMMMLYEDIALLSRVYENMLYCFRTHNRTQDNTNKFANYTEKYLDRVSEQVANIPISGYQPIEVEDLTSEMEQFTKTLSFNQTVEEKPADKPIKPVQTKRKRQVYYIPGNAESSESTEISGELTDFNPVARKLEAVVDEMSVSLEKPVRLLVEGENLKIERRIREKISAALIHLVRNAVDHGIEEMDEREKKGKSPMGMIWLSFEKGSDGFSVCVRDDGTGIKQKKILDKAKKQNLLTKPEEEYTESEVMELLLESGFTTADKQNEYSGRGVGMDVINHNVKELGGILEIHSTEGVGTTITMKIPV